MQKRHLDLLLNRLDDLYRTRVTHIKYSELYLWYGRERLSKAVYQEIFDLWLERLEELGWDAEKENLKVSQNDYGMTLFWMIDTQDFKGWMPR